MLIPLAVGLGRSLVGGLIKRGAKKVLQVGATLGAKTVGGAIIRTTAATAAGTLAVSGVQRIVSRGSVPMLPPGFAPGGQGPQVPQPRGLGRRTLERIVPGGRTGREFTAVGELTDKIGRPLAVFPAAQERLVGPPGYVLVDFQGERIAMLRQHAIRAGLYRAPPRPPVSGWDMRAITRAASASKRVRKLAQKVGWTCVKKGSGRALKVAARFKK